ATHNPLESRWKCFHKGFTGDQRSSQKNCIKGENLKAFEKVRDFFGMTCNTRRTSHERSLYSRNCSRRLRWSGDQARLLLQHQKRSAEISIAHQTPESRTKITG